MEEIKGLKPLEQQGTAARIADELRALMIDGSLRPAAPLSELQLARQLGVSRAPVREALHRLMQEGLLEKRFHGGWSVAAMEPDDVRDCYYARGLVERAAAAAAIRDVPREDLRSAIEDMRKAVWEGDWDAVSVADMRFHEALVASTGSKRLMRMFRTLAVETSMCLRALGSAYTNIEDVVREHEEVLAALESGDEVTAVGRIDKHMEGATKRLLTRLDRSEATP